MAPLYNTDEIAQCVQRFRERRPHVHCITNSVAQHFTANVVLAAGARPSMTIARSEIADFVSMADALLVNLGTMDAERKAAISIAVETAKQQSKPWALDPVFVQASPERLALAEKLLAERPTLVRCNDAEAKALFQSKPNPHSTIALTGKIDTVSKGDAKIALANGAELMDRITAMGCALNALMIGFAAVESDTMLAAVSAISLYNIAGEQAEKLSAGPGTFLPHFLDCLASVDGAAIAQHLRFA